jgi:hypothetical protein
MRLKQFFSDFPSLKEGQGTAATAKSKDFSHNNYQKKKTSYRRKVDFDEIHLTNFLP